jgi:transposase
MTYRVADGALSSEANLQKLAQTHMQWITRVPATVGAAQAVLAEGNPQALTVRHEGFRDV